MVKLSSDIIEIKFSGGEISPSKIALSELSHNILLLEKLIKPIIEEQQPSIQLDKTFAGLQELGNRSISLRYVIKEHKDIVLAGFALLIQCITDKNIESLPTKTVDEIQTISRFNSKYHCQVELGETVGDNFQTYVNFGDEYVAEKLLQIKGSTTVYGEIEWVGGAKPTITLVLKTGEKIDVEVTKEDAHAWQAYSNVGIVGDAVWRGKDLKLSKLVAKEIFAFNNCSPNDGFKYLKNLFKDTPLTTDNI